MYLLVLTNVYVFFWFLPRHMLCSCSSRWASLDYSIDQDSSYNLNSLNNSSLRVQIAATLLGNSLANCSRPLCLTSPAGWLPRTGISSRTVHFVIEYGLPYPFSLQYSDMVLWSCVSAVHFKWMKTVPLKHQDYLLTVHVLMNLRLTESVAFTIERPVSIYKFDNTDLCCNKTLFSKNSWKSVFLFVFNYC